jgi:hypothetical protein
MSRPEHVGPALVKVSLVPARAAYLIRAGSRKGMRRAIQEASTRWGGMTEPIIPVHRNGTVDSWWRAVVRVAKVEGLVDVDAGPDAANTAGDALGLPVVPLKDIDRWGPTMWTLHPASLPYSGDPTQAPVISCENGTLWQAVAAGDFSPEHERHADSFRFRRPHSPDQVARASMLEQTFMAQTVTGFYERSAKGGPWPIPAVVWVTAKDSIRDCVWFWNFRAIQSRNFEPSPMIIVPETDVRHWLNFSRDLATLLARPDEFSPDVSVMSITVPEQRLHTLATEVLGLLHTNEKMRTGHKSGAELRRPPFTYRVNLELRHDLIFERDYGREVEVEAHPTDGRALLRFSSPIEFATTGGNTLMRLASTAFEELPRKDIIADKLVPNATWKDDSLQILTHAMQNYRLHINLPALDECVKTLITAKTSQFSLSEKGRLADAIATQTDLPLLLRPGVYEVTTHLTTPRSSTFKREMDALRSKGMPEDEVQALAARWGGRGARSYDSVSGFTKRLGKRAINPVAAFETLCEIGWAERGVETNCARCGLRSFVPIATLDLGARCPGCRAATSYTADSTGLAVQYRLNTLIDLASDQGVLPHLLVIAALTSKSEHTSLLGGTLVTLPGGSTPEVDILGVHDQQFVAGEVKTKARDFTPQQLERDISVSSRLDVDTHILAAIDIVPDTVVKAASELASKTKMKLLVLSQDELRPSTATP